MSYRPDDWDYSYEKVAEKIPFFNPKSLCDCTTYEAGADAVLEALRKNQWCPFDMSVLNANFKGKVVIIPDDEGDR